MVSEHSDVYTVHTLAAFIKEGGGIAIALFEHYGDLQNATDALANYSTIVNDVVRLISPRNSFMKRMMYPMMLRFISITKRLVETFLSMIFSHWKLRVACMCLRFTHLLLLHLGNTYRVLY